MVRIIPNQKTGAIINQYGGSTKNFGYLQLSSNQVRVINNRVESTKRTCLLRGNISDLEALVDSAEDNKLPGKIRVIEVLETSVREFAMGNKDVDHYSILRSELHSELIKTDFEGAIEGFLKKNPETDEVLKAGEDRILRFRVYDMSDKGGDILIEHDR